MNNKEIEKHIVDFRSLIKDVIYHERFITFDPIPHKYQIRDLLSGEFKTPVSTTTLIHKHTSVFDENYWAEKKGDLAGVSPDSVKKWWGCYNKISTHSGSLVHDVNENFYNRIMFDGLRNPSKELYDEMYNEDLFANDKDSYHKLYEKSENEFKPIIDALNKEKIQKNQILIDPKPNRYKILGDYFWNFYLDTNEYLVPVLMETIIGNSSFLDNVGLTGMIDCIFYDIRTGKFHIYDYKTNANFKMSNDFQNMKGNLSHLPECNYYEYAIQMSIYRYMITLALKYHGFKADWGESYLIHLSELNPNYNLIEVPYLWKEVESIILKKIRSII